MDILEMVKQIQKTQRLTDTQVSDLLGYKYRESWAHIKVGTFPANRAFQMRVIKAFPELASAYAETPKQGWFRSLVNKIL